MNLSDYNKLKTLLDGFGVKYEDVTGVKITEYRCGGILCSNGKRIRVDERINDYNGKVTGYSMFFTTFEFTTEGKFIQMGAWE